MLVGRRRRSLSESRKRLYRGLLMCISGFGQTPCTQWGLLTASGCCGLDDDVRCKAAMPLQSPQVTASVSPHVAAMGRGWVLNSAGGTCALRPVRTCKPGPLWGGGVFPCGQKAGGPVNPLGGRAGHPRDGQFPTGERAVLAKFTGRPAGWLS